ncbi:MAG TPA: OmpA family protein [Gemmatimonadaceae bacterium]|nr:OmpA family protein [Gemmatimonadaceae bacterium]
MSIRAFTVGVAALVWAVPAIAQQRGTMEFGAFGSAASFDNALSLKTAFGGGGRIGMYLSPRWSVEFEDAEMRATRPNGLNNVNVGVLSGRLVAVPIEAGAVSFLLGGGAGISTETNFLHSYGVDGLVGMKIALGHSAALRIDGVWDWLANQNWKTYRSVRVGLSLYRWPSHTVRTITVMSPAPPALMAEREDSVSAMETRRLRERDAALRALRDSLNDAPVAAVPVTSAATLATMQARIHFAFNKSDITDSAKAILDEKVEVFRANPGMTIVIRGYTDVVGTDAYNMALGERRAQAAKDYIVSKGIAPSRIILQSRGERQQIPNSAGAAGQAPNRRAVFELLIVPAVVKPE